MKVISQGDSYQVQDTGDGPMNTVLVWLSTEDSPDWHGPIPFVLDSGSAGVCLCENSLYQLGIELAPIGTTDNESANGHVDRDPVVKVNLRIQSIGSKQAVDFYDVIASVSPGASQNLLGMSLLRYFSIFIKTGSVAELSFDPKLIQATQRV